MFILRESSCANPAFTAAVACNDVVAVDPEPLSGEGGASADVAVLFDVDAEFVGAGVVSEFDGGGGEVRPGGVIAWMVLGKMGISVFSSWCKWPCVVVILICR